MIRYSLICEHEHEFEGWFRDSATFDAQAKSGEVSCPSCGSTHVSKALMAPSVSTREEAGVREKSRQPVPMAAPDPRQVELMDALRRLKKQVVDNSDYVGSKFPEEARKIHYEEAERRSIYGEASLEEAKSLIEEGVEVQPLPVLPDEKN